MEAESVLLHTFEEDNKSSMVYYNNRNYIVVFRETRGQELIRSGAYTFNNELDAELFAEILIEGV